MQMKVDFTKTCGRIKPMHAVGQPPMCGLNDSMYHYLTEAHIPYSRQHDTGGIFGGNMYVDIPNVFRDFNADENDPASYDFTFTDFLISSLKKAGVEPYYRLGVTIENYSKLKAYRIYPPADYDKWARICEHIIRHYNEGWADGFEYGITYWEIWNEPDGQFGNGHSMMWLGTKEQYYQLYVTAAKHLKSCFGDSIKVGGYASCGFYAVMPRRNFGLPSKAEEYFLEFFEGFLDTVRKEEAPLDFFSWHSYAMVEDTLAMVRYVDQKLAEYGFEGVENHCNEWNNAHELSRRGTSYASSQAAAMMLAFQHASTAIMCYYDARLGPSEYGGLFDPMKWKPVCTYYSFRAFGELYALGNECPMELEGQEGLYALAASDGQKKAVMISNVSGQTLTLETNLPENMRFYLVDASHHLTMEAFSPKSLTLENEQVLLGLAE